MSDLQPAVSVVLPVFNGEKHLEESIESVLGQTFRDFELIVFDDASTDASWEIVDSFRDERMIGRRQPRNQGLFPNLNDALKMARGRLIRLWTQDDRMRSQCLEREQVFWKRRPAVGMFYCSVDTIDSRGKQIAESKVDGTPEVVASSLADEISFNWGSMPGNICNVSIPRSTLEVVGLFDEDYRLAADFEMWVRIQGAGFPIGCCREKLVELRRHEGQLSRSPESHLTFMREESRIREILERRLPTSQNRARRRYQSYLRVLYFNSAVRAFSRGNFRYGWKILKQLREWDSLAKLAVLWMATANLRLYRPDPIYSERGA